LQTSSPALAAADTATFQETQAALETLLMIGAESEASARAAVENHWRICAAILHLGELQFDPVETRSALAPTRRTRDSFAMGSLIGLLHIPRACTFRACLSQVPIQPLL
jgi:hypothetical protein